MHRASLNLSQCFGSADRIPPEQLGAAPLFWSAATCRRFCIRSQNSDLH